MNVGRRWLLMLTTAIGLASASISKAALISGPQRQKQPKKKTDPATDADPLPAYFDTLIPADKTPSATELGIDHAVRVEAQKIKDYPRLLRTGAKWLNRAARQYGAADFASLNQKRRDAIVTAAAAAKPRSVPRVFFDRTRYDAMRLYYADERSWPGLGFDGPPQPQGFTDHTKPPVAVKP